MALTNGANLHPWQTYRKTWTPLSFISILFFLSFIVGCVFLRFSEYFPVIQCLVWPSRQTFLFNTWKNQISGRGEWPQGLPVHPLPRNTSRAVQTKSHVVQNSIHPHPNSPSFHCFFVNVDWWESTVSRAPLFPTWLKLLVTSLPLYYLLIKNRSHNPSWLIEARRNEMIRLQFTERSLAACNICYQSHHYLQNNPKIWKNVFINMFNCEYQNVFRTRWLRCTSWY